jgi:hypothetical protein
MTRPIKKTNSGSATKRKTKAAKAKGKLSAIDAAAKVLAETGQPMSTPQLIEAMAAKGYWKSPGGLTPERTLYSSITREIDVKGKDARFVKADPGKFTLRA